MDSVKITTTSMSASQTKPTNIKLVIQILSLTVLLVLGTNASAYETKYVGRFNGVDWWIEPYSGQQPGLGIITFNLIEKRGSSSNNQPLFVKCKTRQFSAGYLAYENIPSGKNILWSLFNKYC